MGPFRLILVMVVKKIIQEDGTIIPKSSMHYQLSITCHRMNLFDVSWCLWRPSDSDKHNHLVPPLMKLGGKEVAIEQQKEGRKEKRLNPESSNLVPFHIPGHPRGEQNKSDITPVV